MGETGRQTMNDIRKTKDELIRELRSLRRKVTALEKSKEGSDTILRGGKTKKKSSPKAETFRDFLEDAPLPYQSLGRNGNILDINEIWLDTLGYKRKEVVGRHFRDFLPPEYREKFGECFRQFKQTNTATTIELELLQKNGMRKMLSFHGKIKRDEKGNFLRTHCIFQDITAQQKAEKELRISRENYQYLVENLNDAIYTVSPEGIILYVSPVIENILGYTPSELIGSPFAELIHPEDLDRIMKEFRDVLAGRLYPGEYRLIKKTGATCWVRTSSRPLYKNNRIVWIHGLLTDITDRQDMEEALKKSYDELRLILDATTEGIWQWDFMKNTLYFSEKWYTMLGYEPFEFPASYENWKALLHPEDREQALAVAEKYLRTKPDRYENEFRLRTKDGRYRWIRTHAKVVERDKNGEAVRFVGHHQDITERKKAEEILTENMREVERLNRLFIGREHRMVELKGEVNVLLEKLGQPKKYKAPDQVEPSMEPRMEA